LPGDVDANLTLFRKLAENTTRNIRFLTFSNLKRQVRERRVTVGQTNHITKGAAYASSDDFRRIFDENMNSF
jgi:hypothetical protein